MGQKQSSNRSYVLPELLAPAGSFEKLVTAIHYGADAVYLGGSRYGLRAKAGNFSDESIREAVRYAHQHKVRIYVTVNIIAHDDDFAGLKDYFLLLEESGVDGLIISDPGILLLARKTVPGLPIHLSTQANVTNAGAATFWLSQGVSRINLARELSRAEIHRIRKMVNGGLEVFVHGALCISYSGRCMLSSYMTGRDANQGNCAHPCRYSYTLVEEKRPEESFLVEEDRRGTYIFNSKDLCLLRRLPELVAAGVDALKIEGRMKSIFYVGGVVRVYRAALDYLATLDDGAWQQPENITIPEEMLQEISRIGTRDLTENFFDERPGGSEMLYHASRFEQEYEPVAVIRDIGTSPLVEARNVMLRGETIDYMEQSAETSRFIIEKMINEGGHEVERANPGNRIWLSLCGASGKLKKNGIFRRRKTAGSHSSAPGRQ
ncbi:MAG: U32 family peptidase C-terminal domain-containing protein [Desulfocapsaceae bacterium]|jgi:putative protease|nr:U32 family peptidase C-terminal domain-containing protein [Desulfocapsaceae bacterium]